MILNEKEIQYLECVFEAFGLKIGTATLNALKLRSSGLTYAEIDEKRGAKGSRQLISLFKKRLSRVYTRFDAPSSFSLHEFIALVKK